MFILEMPKSSDIQEDVRDHDPEWESRLQALFDT